MLGPLISMPPEVLKGIGGVTEHQSGAHFSVDPPNYILDNVEACANVWPVETVYKHGILK